MRTFSRDIDSVWVASTSRTWLVPMPKAIAPNAPCVAVWLSPQATVMPGWVRPCSGAMMCTTPCLPEPGSNRRMPYSRQLRAIATIISSARPSA